MARPAENWNRILLICLLGISDTIAQHCSSEEFTPVPSRHIKLLRQVLARLREAGNGS